MSTTAKPKPKMVRDLSTFSARHERHTVVRNKVEAALAELRALGSEYYEYELNDTDAPSGGFVRRADISVNDLSLVRSEFEDYVVEAPTPGSRSGNVRKVWFGDKAAARKARGGKNGKQA